MTNETEALKDMILTATNKLTISKLQFYINEFNQALNYDDNDKFIKTLMLLSSETDLELNFAYPLVEDFKSNIKIAFIVVNAITEQKINKSNVA